MLSSQEHDTQDRDTPFLALTFSPVSLLLIPYPGIYTSLHSCHCSAVVYKYSSYHLPIITIPFVTPFLSSGPQT